MGKLSGVVALGMLLAFCAGAGNAADVDTHGKANDTAAAKPLKHQNREARKEMRQRQHHSRRPNHAAINNKRANRAN